MQRGDEIGKYAAVMYATAADGVATRQRLTHFVGGAILTTLRIVQIKSSMAKKAKKLFIDAPSTSDIYRGIGADLSALTVPPSQGRQRIFSILFQIDIFVEEALASNELAYVIRRGDGSVRFAGNPYATWDDQRGLAIAPLALARHFPLLHIFLQIYTLPPSAEGVRYRIRDNIDGLDNFLDEEYVFGSYVALFFEGCAKLGLVQDILMYEKASFPIGNNRVAGDAFNDLIAKIRALSKILEAKKTRRAGVTLICIDLSSLQRIILQKYFAQCAGSGTDGMPTVDQSDMRGLVTA